MSGDDNLKTFLKKNDVPLERPAHEWESIVHRISRQEVQPVPTSQKRFIRFRLAMAGGLIAAGLIVALLLPRGVQVDENGIIYLLNESGSYFDELNSDVDLDLSEYL